MSEAELVVLTRPERIYVGVDVGRRHHVVSAVARSTFEEGGARWQSAPTLKVEVNRAGFERIAALVAKLRTDERVEVVAGVEPTGGYYARTVHAFLVSLGVEVHWVKNAAVHDARDAVYGRKTRTDPVDARLIARLLYLRDAVGQEYAFSTGYEQIGAYATLRLLVGNRWSSGPGPSRQPAHPDSRRGVPRDGRGLRQDAQLRCCTATTRALSDTQGRRRGWP